MIGKILVKEITGPRHLGKFVSAKLKRSWFDGGLFFHTRLREERFTERHARLAGYAPRKGEEYHRGDKRFWQSYTGRKYKKFGHTRPLEFTGNTRKAISQATISSTSVGVRISYPGANKFNYKNPFSAPGMNLNLEFRSILPVEAEQIATVINRSNEWAQRAVGFTITDSRPIT
jgi:hypothetical protein